MRARGRLSAKTMFCMESLSANDLPPEQRSVGVSKTVALWPMRTVVEAAGETERKAMKFLRHCSTETDITCMPSWHRTRWLFAFDWVFY